jgi:hypothetical protein
MSRSPHFQNLDGFEACYRSVKAVVQGKRKDEIVARHRSASRIITLVSLQILTHVDSR